MLLFLAGQILWSISCVNLLFFHFFLFIFEKKNMKLHFVKLHCKCCCSNQDSILLLEIKRAERAACFLILIVIKLITNQMRKREEGIWNALFLLENVFCFFFLLELASLSSSYPNSTRFLCIYDFLFLH